MTDKMPDEIYISQDREYPDTWRDVSWGFDKSPLKYISEQKHAEEIAALKAEHTKEMMALKERLSTKFLKDVTDAYANGLNAAKAEHRAEMAGLCDEIERTVLDSTDNWTAMHFEVATKINKIKQRISDE